MRLNIRGLKSIGKDLKLRKSTTWQRALVAVVYFLLFTFLISSGLFVSKLHLEVGDPSPQLIVAPWEKDIEDLDKYHEDQEAAAKAIKPIYKPDEDFLTGVARDLSKSFMALRDAISSTEDEGARISKLRQTSPFAALPQGVLTSLTKASLDLIIDKEQQAVEIIIGNARSVDRGARNQTEVASLRDLMKQDINRTPFPDDFKIFLSSFVDAKITRQTLIEDSDATEKLRQTARATVRLEVHRYRAQQKIVGPGEIVDEKVMRVLAAYGLVESRSPWPAVGGISIIVFACLLILALFTYQYRRNMPQITKKLILMGLVSAFVLLFGKAVIALNLGGPEFNALVGILIPVAWATMTVAILIDAEMAYLTSFILSVFVAILADPLITTSFGLQVGLVALFGGIVGVHSVSHLSQRSDLARAGLYVAAMNALAVSGIALISGMRLSAWAVSLLLGIINGLAASVLAVGTLHWFETAFGITSAVRLLELSNPNRPLLKRLLMEAPGTYHHSVLVGNLAEAAAEQVNANAILVRVGAMYHDIGKIKRPYFFIENQFAQDNPHDKIAPTLSSLIITSHIKDGLEMAKEEKLPQGIQDIIAQHHGDSLVTFFYHKAIEDKMDVPEEAFQYEGPKPQTKEAAIVLLADSVEAAVRSMKQATPGKIEGLVRKIIKDKLNDDQLNQSDLTFQDLDKIATAFVRVLSGIFHSRVEYPEMPNKQGTSDSYKVMADVDDAQEEEGTPVIAMMEDDSQVDRKTEDTVLTEPRAEEGTSKVESTPPDNS
jgi:cyclic-di-AMP phosphodiesterase PgpH